jgi:hypothetical protein
MLMYYLPGLEVSKISDSEFANRIAHLLTIRKMEQEEMVSQTIKKNFR